MADAVTSQTLMDGERLAIMKFTNISDGTGETAVTKVNVSSLNSQQLGQSLHWCYRYQDHVRLSWHGSAHVLGRDN
jgi:hypothetical protein